MAIQETGLGWYADEDWLTDQTGVIAELNRGGATGKYGLTPNGTLWVADTSDMPDQRIYIGRHYNEDVSNYMDYYFVNTTGVPVVIALEKDGGWSQAIGAIDNADYGVVSYNDNCKIFKIPPSGIPQGQQFNQYLHWQSQYQNIWAVGTYGDSNLPYASSPYTYYNGTRSENIEDICYQYSICDFSGVPVVLNKTNGGATVACLVKWKESIGGDTYISPILISSENSNTFWDIGGNVPIQQTTEHTFQGMNFFMRLSKQLSADDYTSITPYVPVLDYSESAPVTSDILFALIASASSLGVGFPPQDNDPYGPGGTTGPAGGDGTFDDTSDIIPDSPLPTYSFASSGFCRIYNPSLAQLNALASYMWTDQTFLQTVINHLKQLLENPVDAVISLSMLPISIPNGSAQEVKIMYIPTGVYMPPALSQIVDVDCGSVFIDEYYGSALDYNPYTKVSMFLPFIGMVDLDTDEVMNQTLYVKYRVDIVSGTCTAKILVGSQATERCLYQFSGDCSISMPLNSADFSAYRAAFIQAAKAVMAGIGAAGAAIDAVTEAVEAQAQTAGAVSSAETSLVPFRDGPVVLHGNSPDNSEPTTIDVGKFGDMLLNTTQNTVGLVTSSKLSFQHASGFSGNSGILGVRRPFVVIKRPRMANPDNYGEYNGRPCSMYLSLAPLKGFTQMQRIHLTGFSSTNPELSEIGEFLKNGVIL